MAQRRMFSPQIVGSDAFLDMSTSARELYFQLGMYADDDGFVNPKRIMRMVGASDDDLRLLMTKRFVLPFENGVVVIKHWRINNLVRKDWYKPTQYLEEKSHLYLKKNGSYTDDSEQGKPLVNEPLTNSLTQVRLGKVNTKDFAEAKSSLPIEIVSDEKKEPRRLPDRRALKMRDWCYGRIKQEYGAQPTPSVGDYIQLQKALKSLSDKDIEYMMNDALDAGKGQTVRSVFTDRQIDIYRQQNL